MINALEDTIPELDLQLEEADLRIMPHALNAAVDGMSTIILLSNDTDILVAMLYFVREIKAHGGQTIWMRGGVGNTTRYIPIHTLATKMGPPLCKIIPAIHALTGTDATSKFGTKAASVKMDDAVDFLVEFGIDPINIDFVKAEQFLASLWKRGFKTMDELRYYLYHQQKKSLCELPPTSRATREHILRAFHYTYSVIHSLTAASLDPTNFGYYEEDELLKPIEGHVLLPPDLPLPCTCCSCVTSRCKCRQHAIPCCIYCKCAFNGECKNPHVVLNVPVQM